MAVIGGVALTAYGHPRMILDLDIVTDTAAQGTLIAFMESRGFVTLHRSSGYSNHRHAERNRGRVDVMYVQNETADRLFASAKELPGPQGRPILVPKPEHLIAMKVRAMKDAPERAWQDLVDVAYLMGLEGIDRDEFVGTSSVRASRSVGVNSIGGCDVEPLDLARDVPTTAEDIKVMSRLRRETPSWFSLTPVQLARRTDGALDGHVRARRLEPRRSRNQ